eukprot:TRINITY_DN15825_c0_g4_i1.p1 TRINITY_DN15825_c0_g4~~TRINITY_DN15825_c0_g4_i1.p1  ORF type:complete len:866 (-),score=128.67 TRINITY_DN15825_c0_g4_i1:67-2346(-)
MTQDEIRGFLDQVSNLRVTLKFYVGNVDIISQSELEELAICFNTDHLPVRNMMVYFREVFQCTESRVERIRFCMDELVAGNERHVRIPVFRENLAEGCPLSKAIKSLSSAFASRDRIAKEMESTGISRNDFLSWAVRTTNRDDCLLALPTTLSYLIIFTICVIMHLRIWSRREVNMALTHWMKSSADSPLGPFFDDVGSPGDYKDWLDLPITNAMYGTTDFGSDFDSEDRPETGRVSFTIAHHSVLIGDAWLERTGVDGSKKTAVFLQSESAIAFLKVHPNNFTGAVRASLAEMEKRGFFNDDTRELNFIICIYNVPKHMFGIVESVVTFDDFDGAEPEVRCFTVMIDAYEDYLAYFFDILFIGFILWVACSEGRDAAAALRLGCGEFWDYLGFMNIVDWGTVIFGCCSCAMWVVILTMLVDERLHVVLRPTSEGKFGRLNTSLDLLDIDAQTTKGMQDALRALNRSMNSCSFVVAINSVFIMLKFFKGFESNNRLKVVTHTLREASIDIMHFFVVFVPVFLVFVLVGHTLFGVNLPEFHSIGPAVMTCFRVVLGEFGWYIDLAAHFGKDLPFGTPFVLLQLWYVLFMFFVSLVLLNMLLGVVLTQYMMSYIRLVTNAPTLLAQVRQYVRTKRQTWKYMSLCHIRRLLENDLEPAHPSIEVSQASLLAAFPGMQLQQAELILKSISGEINGGLLQPDNSNLLSEVESLVMKSSSFGLDLREDVACTSSLFDTLEESLETHARMTLNETRSTKSKSFESL